MYEQFSKFTQSGEFMLMWSLSHEITPTSDANNRGGKRDRMCIGSNTNSWNVICLPLSRKGSNPIIPFVCTWSDGRWWCWAARQNPGIIVFYFNFLSFHYCSVVKFLLFQLSLYLLSRTSHYYQARENDLKYYSLRWETLQPEQTLPGKISDWGEKQTSFTNRSIMLVADWRVLCIWNLTVTLVANNARFPTVAIMNWFP